MPSNLLTVAEAREILNSIQPTVSRKFATDGPYIEFTLFDDVFEGWKAKQPSDAVNAMAKVGNAEFKMTKEAFLRALALIGLREAYVLKTPLYMTQEALNYHMSHSGASHDSLRLQARGDIISTFLPGDSLAVSSVKFLDMVALVVNAPLMVDPKICNTMSRMAIRLVAPTLYTIGGSPWSPGIQITNSATSVPSSRPSMTGLMYNWDTESLVLSSHARSGVYDRRSYSADDDEFSDWVTAHTPNILHGLEQEVTAIEDLCSLDLSGQLGDTMTDLFRTLKVPARVRPTIYNNVINQDDRSGYMLMQAMSQAANTPGLDDEMAARTMAVAGALPHLLSDRCETCHKVNV